MSQRQFLLSTVSHALQPRISFSVLYDFSMKIVFLLVFQVLNYVIYE